MQVQDCVALVTGANRGIGRALVERLLALGARRIYAGARDPRRLDDVVALDRARVIPLKFDITNDGEIAAAAARARDVTLVINNAGVASFGSVLTADFEQIEIDTRTNYFGTLKVARTFAPILEANGGGALVNVLTIIALASMPGLGGYCASKAAAYSLTQSLRAELKARGVAVHGVYPGPVDTDMIRAVDMPKTPPEEVARAVLAGIEAGDEDIRPDPMSQQSYRTWLADPKALERQFGAM